MSHSVEPTTNPPEALHGLIVELRSAEEEVRRSESRARAAHERVRDHLARLLETAALELAELDRARDALREAELRTRSIFENVRDATIVLEAVRDGLGRVIDWRAVDASAVFLDALSMTKESFVGRCVGQLLPERFVRRSEELLHVLETGERTRYETTIGERSFLVTVFRIDGRTIGISGVEVTEVARSLAALRESDRMKTDFLAVLSHELRSPLAPIKNSLYLLEHARPGSDEAVRAREVIQRQTEHLTRLVDDLLDLSRINVGKIELVPRCFDARLVARRVTEDLRAVCEERGLTLDVAIGEEPVWIVADETRVAQILGNLVTNAAKFTPRGGRIRVELAMRADSCGLTVSDTGAGIEPELLERIFEPFAQAERTRGRTRGGLGIGLALVKQLARLQGGDVVASSAGRDRGAELVVTLPLASEPCLTEPVAAAPTASGLSVLIIEDDVDARETLRDLLVLLGYRAVAASDAESGVAAFESERPDAVLCDVGLPDQSGYDVVRRVRALEGDRHTFCIAVTGYAQADDVRSAGEAGFDAHLPKPPPLDDLLELLARAAHRGPIAARTA